MKTSFTVDHEGKQYSGQLELTYDSDGQIQDVECIEAFEESGRELTEIEVNDIWFAIEEFVEKGEFDTPPTFEDVCPDTMDEDLR